MSIRDSETAAATIGPIEWSSDHLRFESLAIPVRDAAEAFLLEMYGRRCDEYEPMCKCCRRWRLLDELTEKPLDP